MASRRENTTEDTAAEPCLIKLHDLRPAPGSKRAKIRVGRGEASKGKTAGRGTKGTKARKQVKAGFHGGQVPAFMHLPKQGGFTNPSRIEYQPANLARIAELYPEGGEVTVEALVQKGVVRKNCAVKILGDGELTVKLDVQAHAFSASAREKIQAAGGNARQL